MWAEDNGVWWELKIMDEKKVGIVSRGGIYMVITMTDGRERLPCFLTAQTCIGEVGKWNGREARMINLEAWKF